MSEVILFDLDGTLTDSGPGIIKCVQYALNYMGRPERDEEKLRSFVGPPLHDQFMEFAGFDSEEADQAVEQYRERYSTIGMYENEVYDKIPEILKLLKESGKILGVASSKPEVFVEEILCHFELREYFDVVVGSELDGSRTEKEDVIEEALRQLGYQKHREKVVMVGDRSYDVAGAKMCGIQCVGAAYGYGGREELEKAGAVYIADKVEDLEILAQADDEGDEEVSPYRSGKKEKGRKMRQTPAEKRSHGRKKSPAPEELGKMLWQIFFPILAHFVCMVGISLLGITLAGAVTGGVGSGYMDVVKRMPWLSSILSAFTAIAVVLFLWKYYMQDKNRFSFAVHWWNWQAAVACVLASAGIGLVWNKLITASGIREIFMRYSEISANSYENQNWFVLIVCVGVFSSIGEELVFRGMVYQRAKSYFGTGWAIGISAALFGMYHGNMVQFLYSVVLGILFAALYERTGSLLAPIAGHIAANIFSISYDYIVDFLIKRSDAGEMILIVVMALLAAASIYFLFFFRGTGRRKESSRT